MNEKELKEIFKDLEEQGWEPQLCDTAVPFYENAVPCGNPTDVGDLICGMELYPKDFFDNENEFMATVRGDSMKDANIFAGDIVVVESGVSISDGDIVLVRIDGECTLKSYCEDENGNPWLVPQNAEYDAFPLKESQSIYVAGRVRDIIRQAPRIKYNACQKYIRKARAKQLEPEEISQVQISQTIREIAPTITVARLWYAVFREMMEVGVVKRWDYDGFCTMVKEEVPDHKHLPTRLELQRMAVGSFVKSYKFWTECDAPVKGKRFEAYKKLAELTKEMLFR